ncbi:hypothetical protein HGRIS_009707 [Hohenbuehelia grisea]|uniref:Pheromone receptor n=1 Tax=Hohenbuehelia grisea TaxID=104357 RepID=A0ABR3J1Z7_9AGAR
MHAYTSAVAFANALSTLLFFLPLPWYLKSWNIGTCVFMVSNGLKALVELINALVWSGNVANKAPAWCQISIQITGSDAFVLPACILAVNRRLYLISLDPTGILNNRQRIIWEDLTICLFLPMVLTGLALIPLDHGFDIYEDLGCQSTYYNTIPGILLIPFPTFLLSVISGIYGALNLLSFRKRHMQIREFFATDSSTLEVRQYFRVVALGIIDAVVTIPFTTWTFVSFIIDGDIHPWSWQAVKRNYGYVAYLSYTDWWDAHDAESTVGDYYNLIIAVFFFGLFGCSRPIIRGYKEAFMSLGNMLQPRKLSLGSKISSNQTNNMEAELGIQFAERSTLATSMFSQTSDANT